MRSEQDSAGRTPLLLAVEKGHVAVVRLLLDLESLPFDKDVQFRMTRIDSKLTPESDFSHFRFESGIDIPDLNGISPYMKAAELGNYEIFMLLAPPQPLRTRGCAWQKLADLRHGSQTIAVS